MKLLARVSVVLSLLLTALTPAVSRAAAANHIVISEVQTGTSASAAQEFVELYNPTAADVDLTGWAVEYKSATSVDQASSWSKKATLTGQIVSDGFYLLAPKTYLAQADASWSAGMAGAAGHIRLVDAGGNVVDKLGYGSTANAPETKPAAAPPADQSLERLPGRLIEDGGNGVDTDDNSADFILRPTPAPQSTASPLEVSDGGNAPADAAPTDPADSAPTPTTYLPLAITELFVNPAAPLSDATDEFVEIYNPNSAAVDVKDYTLRTGSNFHDYYVLPSFTLDPGSYAAFKSSQTKLSLTNSGGAAELLDPTGQVVNVTPAYDAAAEGQAWALGDDGGWHWTIQPTPGAANQIVAPVLPALAVSGTKDSSASKSAKTSSASSKSSAPKTAKSSKTASAGSNTKSSKLKTGTTAQLAADKQPASAIWLIAVLAVLTLGYAAYEFRHDLYLAYRFVRRQFGAGA